VFCFHTELQKCIPSNLFRNLQCLFEVLITVYGCNHMQSQIARFVIG